MYPLVCLVEAIHTLKFFSNFGKENRVFSSFASVESVRNEYVTYLRI